MAPGYQMYSGVQSPPPALIYPVESTMELTLAFGTDSIWHLEAPGAARLGPSESGGPAADLNPAEAIRHVLAQPLDFPALASATVPGDNAVVPIEPGTPCAGPLAVGVVQALVDAGLEPTDITLLLADEPTHEQVQSVLASGTLDQVRIERHRADDEEACGFLGLSESDKPLRLSRALCMADLVLPVGTTSAQWEETPLKFGGLFPEFADGESIRRFHAPISRDSQVHRRGRREEIDRVGWLLGVMMVVKVVPASNGQVAAVFAGEPEKVASAAAEQHQSIWSPSAERRGDLAVALVNSQWGHEPWQQIASALHAAESVLEDGGAVVLCTDLHQNPGRSVGRLGDSGNRQTQRHEIFRDRHPDSWAAWQLAKALDRGPVYLHSRLENQAVEALGITPLETPEELARLIGQHTHCTILDSAQRLTPRH